MTASKWIKPQLCKLATRAPSGALWVHEIKFDGYRMAAPITAGKVQLLTRSGLDWTAKYPATAGILTKLPVRSAYLDGELCAVRPNGVFDFSLMQEASDRGGASLVY
jgi:bifunctional non-homologous end joining protein LigD